MKRAIRIFAVAGFAVCLVIMYATDLGIPGIQKYAANFRLLDMQLRYDADTVHNAFKSIGSLGREAYQSFLLLDFVFIVCLLSTMLAITSMAFRYSQAKAVFLWACILRALFDILENSLLLFMLNSYPIFSYTLADICSWITTLKFTALSVWILGIVIWRVNTAFCSIRRHKC